MPELFSEPSPLSSRGGGVLENPDLFVAPVPDDSPEGGSQLYFAAKRMFDVLASAAAIVGLSPVFLLTMAAVKLEDGGPVFYSQKRVGRDEKVFSMLKFRSMRVDAEKIHDELRRQYGCDEVSFKLKDDPRVTRVGRLIRKMNIDELPQLFNILKGDMSIVGPRPLPIYEFELERRLYGLKFRTRYTVPQGLTCFWQVSHRADISFDQRMDMDVRYAESHSFLRDLYLIGVTAAQILTGRAGY